MKKIVLLVAAVAMLFAMAVPASAHGGNEVGAFNGTADVGKESDDGCNPNETRSGLGVPVLTGEKYGFWSLDTEIQTVNHGLVDLLACGKLSPVAGVGAACGMSAGSEGKGDAVLQSDGSVIDVDNLAWPATAGGTLPVEGTYTSANHGNGVIRAVVQAQGADACATKTSEDKAPGDGATEFIVGGVITLIGQ